MTVAEVLRKARAKIEKPESWTRYTRARDRSGVCVDPCDERAVSFCSFGAIEAVAPRQLVRTLCFIALERALSGTRERDPRDWQDEAETSHADVLALFDRAIAGAEAV